MSDEIKETGVAFEEEEEEEVGMKKTKLGTEEEEEVDGRQGKRARRVVEKDVEEEEELEEFFLILRRMQEALNYFKNSKGRDGNKEMWESTGRWRAMLDEEILTGRTRIGHREEAGTAEENSGLDLNKVPQPLEDNP